MEKVSIDKGEIGECCGEGVRGMWEGELVEDEKKGVEKEGREEKGEG